MDKVSYMGYTLIPYGNIIGKDEQTRFQRLSWRTDTLTPLLNKADGYDYHEFNKAAGAAADIYYCSETKRHYVPTGGGLCSIDIAEMRKYIRVFEQDSKHLNQSEDSLYSLDAMKKVLGDDYGFHQTKTVDEIKKILETGEMDGNDNVAIVLEAGNLDIELMINFGEYRNDELITPIHPEYFCCVRTNGEWASYDEISEPVNLDVPDIEAEMFRILDKFAEERSLTFFTQNDRSTQNQQSLETEDEDDMEM